MMETQTEEFNVIQFEKRLTSLKDSQDHINACGRWCLDNRPHHKKIVNCWLNVLKRVKIEQRLNLFYLANDVIQYSKRKHYEFVDSWGTALQKATTLVRDDKVKHKIVRIFTIWQQRGVYNEEFISDLCGLISVVPTASKNDDPHEFQSSYVINKIKQCSKLENDTDTKLKVLKEHNPKIQNEVETLCSSLKDRAKVDDVEQELDTYVKHLEAYINALKAEIKCRITNISVLKQANTQLEKDKRDVKVVGNAYKVFGNKVKAFQKKLEEHKETLSSPVPSPDINAPSPSPDCDIELPDDEPKPTVAAYDPTVQFTPGYYTPVPPPVAVVEPPSPFATNGYASFIGSNFQIGGGLFGSSNNSNDAGFLQQQQQRQAEVPQPVASVATPQTPVILGGDGNIPGDPLDFSYGGSSHSMPLLPPPMPPFDDNNTYNNHTYTGTGIYNQVPSGDPSSEPVYDSSQSSFNASFDGSTDDRPGPGQDYNPEQEPENWGEPFDDMPNPVDTPESPPNFEKKGYVEGVVYHDGSGSGAVGAADVDQRVLQQPQPHRNPLLDNVRGRGKDVDHRNLISLTASPNESAGASAPLPWNPQSQGDQDYRVHEPLPPQQPQPQQPPKPVEPPPSMDQDYRMPPPFNLAQLKLPPPPPPPPNRGGGVDDNDSIDMDLSEEDEDRHMQQQQFHNRPPPPPFPPPPLHGMDQSSVIADDAEANALLDDIGSDLDFAAHLHPPPPPPQLLVPLHQNNNNFRQPMAPPSQRPQHPIGPPMMMMHNNNNNNNNFPPPPQHGGPMRGRGGDRGGPRRRGRGYRGGGSDGGGGFRGGRGGFGQPPMFRGRGRGDRGLRRGRGRGGNNGWGMMRGGFSNNNFEGGFYE